MDFVRHDLRFALRQLVRNPGFAVIAIVTLALGIGANTAVFSLVHGVLLRPLDFPEPDRLYTVWENHERRDGPAREWTNRANFIDWRERNRSFEGMAVLGGWRPNLTGIDRAEGLIGERVSPGYFSVLGVRPAIGRAFAPEEETPGRDRVVVITHSLWRRHFGADPGVLGSTVTLNGESFTLVGVMPPGFAAPIVSDAEIWAPLAIDPDRSDRGNAYLRVIARLAPGIDAADADSDMDRVAREIAVEHPSNYGEVGVALVPLHEFLVGPARTPLLLLLTAVGLVLLIACSNIANLLIVRLSARERELAVRAAIGAGRARLARQLLTEALMLAGLGGALGLALGLWGMELLRRFAPDTTPRIEQVGFDATVFGFALLATLAAGVLVGLLPAGRLLWGGGLAHRLRGSAQGTATGARGRLRRALVATELALGLTLLVGAGLLVRSLVELHNVDPGIRTGDVLSARLLLPASRYPDDERMSAAWAGLEERLEARPGVERAGAVSVLPLSGSEIDLAFLIEGSAVEPGSEPGADYRAATPGYFSVMGIPLVRGRLFEHGDVAGADPVALVSAEFARRFFPDGDPIGRRLKIGSPDSPWWTIVGIVGSVRDDGIDQPPEPEMYVPYAQAPSRAVWTVLRSRGDPGALAAVVRDEVHAFDSDLPVTATATMDELVRRNLATPSFLTWLLASFAMLALVLAAVGIYGVIAHAVSQRTREIGIRMALGADVDSVLRLVLRDGVALVAAGLAIGWVASLAATRAMSSLLFQVNPADARTLLAVSVLLAAVALIACWVPARRAARIDPILALKAD